MAIELEPSMPMVAPWPIMNPAPTPVSTTSSIQHSANACKGKAKATEDDDNNEKATQKLRKELEDFVVLTTCNRCIADNMADHCWYLTGKRPCWHCYRKSKDCLWNGVSVRTQKKSPPLAALVMAKHIKLVQAAKAFLERQGKPPQFFILEGYKGKGEAKALLEDSEPTGAKRSFKSRELVDSNSDEEDEEDRVCVIKKIKRKHVEEPTGAKRRKEIMKLDEEVEIVAQKYQWRDLRARPQNPFTSKFILKPIVMLASPVAGPSTAPIVSSSAPKPAAAAALSKPVPAKSAGPAVKGGFIFKDPFMVRQFKLAGTEESRVLIINNEESGDEDAEGDNDNSDSGDVAMNIDSAKQPEETRPVALTKTTVTEVKVPALVTDKTEEDSLLQIALYH
ncbi:hypothetical protein C0995_010651 [Termitomyces sp. Mi166|nr:hypothetical protein C0995_010651 [Termitomyces sp. Mi166\